MQSGLSKCRVIHVTDLFFISGDKMTTKTPHRDADMIYQWSQDTTRKISRRNYGRAEEKWLSFDPYTSGWHTSYIYRFDDEKPKIVSSLTDEEIQRAWKATYDEVNLRNIANVAAQRAIGDLKAPDMHWIAHNCDEWDSRITFIDGIKRYLRDVKEGKL